MQTIGNLNQGFGLKGARTGVDQSGNRWEETIFRTDEDVFSVQVRSDNPGDCFNVVLTLQELFEYTDTAIQPFVWAVISGDAPGSRERDGGLVRTPRGKLYLVEKPARPSEREVAKPLSLADVSGECRLEP